jgi:hypothetical protein
MGMDGLRMLASWFYEGFARYYYIVLTDRRLITIKMKAHRHKKHFFSRPIFYIGSEEKYYEETNSINLEEISKSARSLGLGGMIWGRVGMNFTTTKGLRLAFVVKRSEKAFPNQKEFYQTIYGKVLAQSTKQLEAAK